MGVFDYVKMEYPLPDRAHQDYEFQTKDTPAQWLEVYRVTREGRLIHEAVRCVHVPERKRPYWGTPLWDENPMVRIVGSQRVVPLGDEDTGFHGDIFVVGWPAGKYKASDVVEYQVRFSEGQLLWIKRVERRPHRRSLRR